MASYWERIRQRKIVQWAIAYIATSALVIGITSDLAQGFAWAVVALRVVAAVLSVGFLAVLVIAWYHGEKGRQRVSGLEMALLAGLATVAGLAATMAAGPTSDFRDTGSDGGEDGIRQQQRLDSYSEIAATIHRYVTEANDLNTTLSVTPAALADASFQMRQNAFDTVTEAILAYSAAWDSIGARRARFETEVDQFWNDGPLLRRDLAGFFDNVVEPLHRSHFLVMNADLVELQRGIQTGRDSPQYTQAQKNLAEAVALLPTQLAQLETRAARILEQLRPE